MNGNVGRWVITGLVGAGVLAFTGVVGLGYAQTPALVKDQATRKTDAQQADAAAKQAKADREAAEKSLSSARIKEKSAQLRATNANTSYQVRKAYDEAENARGHAEQAETHSKNAKSSAKDASKRAGAAAEKATKSKERVQAAKESAEKARAQSANAKASAKTAQDKASAAKAGAEDAKSNAEPEATKKAAEAAASHAQTAAESAKRAADAATVAEQESTQAKDDADQAASLADTAKDEATHAETKANEAVTKAGDAETASREAKTHASEAKAAAHEALKLSDQALAELKALQDAGVAAEELERYIATRALPLKTGPRVDFPPFVGPGKEKGASDAGCRSAIKQHEVVSAVVNLHYFRNAHRVAQILNRKVESHNAANVNLAQRAAADARAAAQQATLDRKGHEDEARQAARRLREAEREIADAEADLAKARSDLAYSRIAKERLEREVAKLDDKEKAAKNANPPAGLSLEEVKARDELKRRSGDFTNIVTDAEKAVAEQESSLRQRLEQARKKLPELQANADAANKLAIQSARQEELSIKKAFSLAAMAAKTDPDTYVPGEVNSVDPIVQVSISVIGEGVIHLRGPRQGVVKIREMINQIDQPVGQVKIGIMTVQVNGERGDRMERTVQRIQGNLSRGRFLTYVAGQYFHRAVVETASEAALAQANPRDFRYLQHFFGDEFIEELLEVDPDTPLLDQLHKLLSLNSMDSTTLGESLFLTALANYEHRMRILSRFDRYIRGDLPSEEAIWMRTNQIHHHWDPRWWGDAERGMAAVRREGARNYNFQAIRSFFNRDWSVFQTGSDPSLLPKDVLNPIQREVVKLAQALNLERKLRGEREYYVTQRALLEPCPHTVAAKLLDTKIADLEERHLELLEGMRGRKAGIDNVIKRIVVALEDDVYAQFYDPAMRRVRDASREWDVELGTVERTTILTNNRALGMVEPQATFEFDLPKRDILIVEAMKAASALTTDLGGLLQDPSFLALASMMSGSPAVGDLSGAAGAVSVLPGTGNAKPAEGTGLPLGQKREFGAALEALIPDPAIYKFETGTAFEVRPVVQPDGQSVSFDFHYEYTTDLLEPVRADEKHLGRVKRHYIDTEVQLGNFEWREISRYEVALKAARNSRGVPLLEDVPVAGMLFRPLPQAKKSLQQNIIIGQAVIYPTVDELLGLKSPALASIEPDDVNERAEELREKQRCLDRRLDEALAEALEEAAKQDAKAGRAARK